MKGAGRVTVNAPRVLYLVISGAPAPEGLASLVTLIQESGWRVVVFSTPMGIRFADLDELEQLTGQPVRWEYRMPGTGERTPPADAVLACPFRASLDTLRSMGIQVLFDPAAPYESRLPADPKSGASSPRISRRVVDFPEPFGPRKPVTTRGRTSKVSASTATFDP